jgi:ASC-1-like (ASCH) protein
MQNNIYKLELDVQEPYLSFIRSGKKTVEGRLGKDKYLVLKKGDLIKINDLELEIVSVKKYPTFKDMLQAVGFKNAVPDVNSLEDAINVYYRFYNKEDEEKFGVAAISIKLVG